jgi:hypothetical protein
MPTMHDKTANTHDRKTHPILTDIIETIPPIIEKIAT